MTIIGNKIEKAKKRWVSVIYGDCAAHVLKHQHESAPVIGPNQHQMMLISDQNYQLWKTNSKTGDPLFAINVTVANCKRSPKLKEREPHGRVLPNVLW